MSPISLVQVLINSKSSVPSLPGYCAALVWMVESPRLDVAGDPFQPLVQPVTYKIVNGYRIYVDIMTGESYRQFRFIGQFVLPVVGEGME